MLKSKTTEDLELVIKNYEIEWNKANIEFENYCLLKDKNIKNDIFSEKSVFSDNINESKYI